MLAKTSLFKGDPNLLVGSDTSDDAAVYRLNDEQAIVATTDFFLPIVDDPYDFGRIAATNAISDIYAMGARPFLALALVGMPVGKLPVEAIQKVLAGGEAICAEAGVIIGGGHSIDLNEPMYGLAVLGMVHPDRIKRNDRARDGDILILGKALGVGIMSAALKKGQLSSPAYRQLIETTTKLNQPGLELGATAGVNALTDVTGFGLLGHLLEICRGSGLRAEIRFDQLPILSEALPLAKAGYATGASDRNWAGAEQEITLGSTIETWQKKLLCDPQTSGGLLVACRPEVASSVLDVFAKQGFGDACVIGKLVAGNASIVVS
jgi:selenide, water dikinase